MEGGRAHSCEFCGLERLCS